MRTATYVVATAVAVSAMMAQPALPRQSAPAFETVADLGTLDGVSLSQLGTRSCERFSNRLLLEGTGAEPFVSPLRSGFEDFALRAARRLGDECLGDRSDIQVVTLYSIYPDPDMVEAFRDPEIREIARLEVRRGRLQMSVHEDVNAHLARLENEADAGGMGCESGSVEYVSTPPDGQAHIPNHWEGALNVVGRAYRDGQLVEEERGELDVEMRMHDEGFFVLDVGRCPVALVPDAESLAEYRGGNTRFGFNPIGGGYCDGLRRDLANGDQLYVVLDAASSDDIQVEMGRRGVANRFGSRRESDAAGVLEAQYPSCIPPLTQEERDAQLRMAFLFTYLIATAEPVDAYGSSESRWGEEEAAFRGTRRMARSTMRR